MYFIEFVWGVLFVYMFFGEILLLFVVVGVGLILVSMFVGFIFSGGFGGGDEGAESSESSRVDVR